MNTTKRFPRTMQEAFGPYTDSRIYEPVESMHQTDRITTAACGIALMALLISLFVWG